MENFLIHVNKENIFCFFRAGLQSLKKVLTWRKNIFFKKYQFGYQKTLNLVLIPNPLKRLQERLQK